MKFSFLTFFFFFPKLACTLVTAFQNTDSAIYSFIKQLITVCLLLV